MLHLVSLNFVAFLLELSLEEACLGFRDVQVFIDILCSELRQFDFEVSEACFPRRYGAGDGIVDVGFTATHLLLIDQQRLHVLIERGVKKALEVVSMEVGDLQRLPECLQPVHILIQINIETKDSNVQLFAHCQIVPAHFIQTLSPYILVLFSFEIDGMPALPTAAYFCSKVR